MKYLFIRKNIFEVAISFIHSIHMGSAAAASAALFYHATAITVRLKSAAASKFKISVRFANKLQQNQNCAAANPWNLYKYKNKDTLLLSGHLKITLNPEVLLIP